MVSKFTKAKPKGRCKTAKYEKEKIFRVIEEPSYWIRDIQKCKLLNKSVLKQSKVCKPPASSQVPGEDEERQPMDITRTLDALETEIGEKRREQRFSEASLASTCSSSGKRLSFSNVSVFYFNRAVGQSSVPRDGQHPLGMGMKHVDYEKVQYFPQIFYVYDRKYCVASVKCQLIFVIFLCNLNVIYFLEMQMLIVDVVAR